jgi:hypothetical protein
MVSCSFSYAGCEEKLPRKDMPAHISDSLGIHMLLQAVHHLKELNELKSTHQKEITELKNTHQNEVTELKSQIRELRTHLWIMPVNLTLGGFAAKKTEGKGWSSNPFYTHPRGYKLYLSVDCNGIREGAGSHISAYIYLRSGEYDDELNWPFRRSITIRLIDQKEGTNHHDFTARFGDAPDACTKRRVVGKYTGWGTPRFISHSNLSPNYLVNDSLYFSILNLHYCI